MRERSVDRTVRRSDREREREREREKERERERERERGRRERENVAGVPHPFHAGCELCLQHQWCVSSPPTDTVSGEHLDTNILQMDVCVCMYVCMYVCM